MTAYPSYTVAIRTLGKAGEKYETLIRSLKAQTLAPEQINVYIPDGYPRPSQVADEIYLSAPKGMVSQRALPYEEITTGYILFCDDDVYLPPDAVKKLFDALLQGNADCIAPNVFPNHEWSLKEKITVALLYGTYPSILSKYAFRIRKSSYYNYALHPRPVMPTQSFAGPCFLIRKEAFRQVHYEDERWIDPFSYANGDDQLLAYKLYLNGFRTLEHFDSGIVHLDARSGRIRDERKNHYNNCILRYVIWYRTIFQPSRTKWGKIHACLCFYAQWCKLFLLALVSWVLRKSTFKVKDSVTSLKEARRFVRSEEFSRIPVWTKKI